MTVAATLFRFEDSYAREVPGLSTPWTAAPAPDPELLVLNEELAVELGVDPAELREPPGIALLVGQAPEGLTTVAQAYAGHQFGVYSPRLGDGRALLLGEVIDDNGEAAVEAATDVLNGFAAAHERHWAEGMAAKLGIAAPDRDLAGDILELMRLQKVDFTRFFRALSAGTARTLFTEPEPFDAWAARRESVLPADRAAVAVAMDQVNPAYIPRNHRVEEALAAATEGEMGPFHRLVDIVARPFDERPGLEDYAGPAPLGPAPYVTYCGT